MINYLSGKAFLYMNSRRAGIIELENKKTISVYNFDNVIMHETDYIAISKEKMIRFLYLSWDSFINSKLFELDQIPEDKDGAYFFIKEITDEGKFAEIIDRFQSVSVPLD